MTSTRRLILAILSSLAVLGSTSGCLGPRLPRTVSVEKNLEFARLNSGPLQLDIYSPKQHVGSLPVVIWIHGGSWDSGSKDFCPIGYMAAQNIAIVSINYRLSGTASYPAQIYDCKGAVRWLRAHAAAYDLDADHIGVFGASAGGQLAAMLGTTAGVPALEGDVGGNLNYSSRVQAVCAFYPPTDLNRLVTDPVARASAETSVGKLLGGALNQNLARADLASPLHFADRNSAPFFLLHGAEDKLVPVEQSELLYEKLQQAGVPAELEIVPGKGHGIIAPPAAAEKIYRFFDRNLRGKS